MAAFSRSDTPEEKRRPFFLYCDEYQRFATSDFATLLAEARKFKIITVLSNQALEQLDDANRAAALQAGNLVSFRVSGEDSGVVAKSFDSTPPDGTNRRRASALSSGGCYSPFSS
jgi:DNA helicase HerA-like ATPase